MFKIGDLILCVDVQTPAYQPMLTLNKSYRVQLVEGTRLHLRGAAHMGMAYHAHRFMPLTNLSKLERLIYGV